MVLVNRLAYDLKIPLTDISVLQLGTPRRGDVTTFRSPKDGIRLIKRLIAVPGDTLEMRDNQLFLNGIYAPHSSLVLPLMPTTRRLLIWLLGEASHGTSEFYRARAAITRCLIEEHGFTIVAVEADWPDAEASLPSRGHRTPSKSSWRSNPPPLYQARDNLPWFALSFKT